MPLECVRPLSKKPWVEEEVEEEEEMGGEVTLHTHLTDTEKRSDTLISL